MSRAAMLITAAVFAVTTHCGHAADTNIASQANVSSSSIYSGGYKAEFVRSDKGEWSSKGEPKPWIKLDWDKEHTVGKLVLLDRKNPGDHTIAGKVTFSDGSSVQVTHISNDGSPRTIFFPSRKVKWLRFQVTESSGRNIGLHELQVYTTTDK
jgi:hypothetical protein